jgi:hypothetical protein
MAANVDRMHATEGRASSPLHDRLVFIVGARRSGTNWLQRVITAHPDVVGIPSETHLFSHGIAPLADRVQHATPGLARSGYTYMSRDAFLDTIRAFCDRMFGDLAEVLDPSARLIAERTPWHVYQLELIGSVYPGARVVHIVRDGRDVARSLLSMSWGPTVIREAAEEWRSSVEAGRKGGATLARYSEVRYEDLLAHSDEEVRRLYEWLELPADTQVLERTLTEAGIPYNVDPKSFSTEAGKWREALSARDVRIFEEVAGDLLDELGYERAPSGRAGIAAPAIRRARSAAHLVRRPGEALAARRRRSFDREALDRIQKTQGLFEDFLAAVHTGRLDRMAELLRRDVLVKIVDAEGEWTGRGEAARDRLLATLEADEALRSPQVRGDVHPSLTDFFSIATYQLPDGSRADRSIVLTARRGQVGAVRYYLWPAALATAGEARSATA